MGYYAEKVRNKSIGKSKKTIKKQLNPIVILVSLMISQKFVNYGHCQEFLIEEYEAKVINYLKEMNYTEEQIKEMLNSNKELVNNCQNSYSVHKQGKMKFYSLLSDVDIDSKFEEILSIIPFDLIDACVTEEALGDMLGVFVIKKSPEVWGYIAGVKRQVSVTGKTQMR